MQDRANINVAVLVEGNDTYGVELSVLNQFLASKDFGIDFHYICIRKGNLSEKLLDFGADVKVIGGKVPKVYPPNLVKLVGVLFSYLKPGFELFVKLRAYLKETQPDIVYTHKPTEHVLGGLAAKSCGIRSVGHLRLVLNKNRNWGLSRILFSWWLSLCLDMGISISEAVRESFWRPMKVKTYCVYNGLDIQAIKQQTGQSAKEIDSSGMKVVSIGRLVSIKKQDVLIDAIGILAKQGLDLNLTLVGGPAEDSNPYYRKLKGQVAAYGLSDRVRFVGYVERPYGIIAKSKASVLCCTKEGFGNVVVEAMACGTPVIVADAGGPSEIVKHDENGLKFTPDNAEELAECLRLIVIDNKRAARYAEKAYSDVVKRFTIELHMKQLREKFCSILNQS
jgi:glycosyltransferase involved in cell wall biosynthesis